jgi:hypothetical protein
MRTFLQPLVAFLVVALWANADTLAHTPADFLEVLQVQAASPIKHAVELKSRLDQKKAATDLSGPEFFARAVGGMKRPVKHPRAYLNWYKIDRPQPQPVRELVVLDMVRGSANKSLKVDVAQYLLSPSQLITSGVPDPVPEGLDHYKAYRVVDAPVLQMEVELTDSAIAGKRVVGKPLFVCIASQEWHHDEYFAASHPNDCFVVYQLDVQVAKEEFNTLDQFGLNELRCKQSLWICVRAALLRTKSD